MAELQNVKVGDLIAYKGFSSLNVSKVDRLTKTTAVCGSLAFRLDTGKMVGSSGYSVVYGRVATEADIITARIQRAQRALQRVIVTEANLEAVESLVATTKEQGNG